MKLKHCLPLVAMLAAASFTAACGDNDASPTSPSEFNSVPGTASFTAPTPDSPADNAQLDTLRPTLTINNGSSNAPSNLPRTYEFQIADNANFAASQASFSQAYRVVISQSNIPEGAGGKTSFTPSVDLQPGALLYWRARLIQIGQASPWSATWSFRTKAAAYNRAGELFDPLVTGTTIGDVVGNVRFIPDVGAQMVSGDSHIRYRLVETISQGEYSMLVTGFDEGSPGDKAKIMSMSEGGSDITTDDYRYTIEYRGRAYSNPGMVAWRVITGGGDDCISDGQRTSVNTTDSETYFWRTSWWADGADLTIRLGSSSGPVLFQQGIRLHCRAYRPNPHFAYVGAPVGRAGPIDATLAGMIARMVYIGVNPRPAGLAVPVR